MAGVTGFKGRAHSLSVTSSSTRHSTPQVSSGGSKSPRNKYTSPSTSPPQTTGGNQMLSVDGKTRRRCKSPSQLMMTVSLCERFPGDMSHRPLEQLRQETIAANRSPHLKKKHIPGADTIDSLDKTAFGLAYHHGGPYDATLLARNRTPKHAPVEALKSSNDEALKATPDEFIKASLERNLPLQGTAIIPPGMLGYNGQLMQYQEGADLMRESDAAGGAYKRWADMEYHIDDLKGKGEPSYTIEKALKKDKQRRAVSGSLDNYEMLPLSQTSPYRRSPCGLGPENVWAETVWNSPKSSGYQGSWQRHLSSGQRVGQGLRKRFESLARNKKTTSA